MLNVRATRTKRATVGADKGFMTVRPSSRAVTSSKVTPRGGRDKHSAVDARITPRGLKTSQKVRKRD